MASMILVTNPLNWYYDPSWRLTYFNVKFVLIRGTTTLQIILFSFIIDIKASEDKRRTDNIGEKEKHVDILDLLLWAIFANRPELTGILWHRGRDHMCKCNSVTYSSVVIYTINKSSKWYIVYICKVFQKGWRAGKFYPYFDFECIIKIHNFAFANFKSSCQYQFTSQTIASEAIVSQNKQYTESV